MWFFFLKFSDSLLVLNQLTILVILAFIIFTSSSGFLQDTNMLESPSKRSENKTFDILARLSMHNKVKRGPNMEPCVETQNVGLRALTHWVSKTKLSNLFYLMKIFLFLQQAS